MSMYKFHRSRWVFFPGYLASFALIASAVWSFTFDSTLTALLILVGLVGFIICEVFIRVERLHLDENRVIYARGFLGVKSRRLSYEGITDVEVSQSLLQRMLGFGNVEISTPSTSDTEIRFKNVASPKKLEELMEKHHVQWHEKKEGKQPERSHSTPPRQSSPSQKQRKL